MGIVLMGLRSQIVVAVVVASSIINLFFCFYFTGQIRNQELQSLKMKINKSAYMMKLVNARPLYNVDKETLRVNMETFFDDENVKRISIFDADTDMNISLKRHFQPGGQDIPKRFYIYYKGLKLGRMEVVYNTGLIEKELARFRIQMLSFTFCIVLLLLLALIFIVNQLMQPVVRLAEAASDIADGNLDRRIQEGGRGELGTLSHNFGVMRDAIKEKMDALETTNLELAEELKQKAVSERKILRQSRIISSVNTFFQKSMPAGDRYDIARLFLPIAKGVIPCSHCGVTLLNSDDRSLDVLARFGTLDLLMPGPNSGMQTHGFETLLDLHQEVFVANDPESHPDFVLLYRSGKELINFMGVPLRVHNRCRGLLAFANKEGGFGPEDREAGQMLGLALAESLNLKYQENERLRLEEMMVQSEKMVSIGGLAAGMAHEINNPLAGILQNTQVVKNRLKNPLLPANVKAAKEVGLDMEALGVYMEKRDIFQMMESVLTAGQRAAGIVSNMLSFSRKSTSKAAPEDICHLMDKTLELAKSDYNLKKQFDFRKILVQREYTTNLPKVPCRASEIQQVFYNILSNGAQAMQASGISSPCFTICINPSGSYLSVSIMDNGPGMDEKTRKRVFEPFFTTKSVGEGTGLGLAVSYFIITVNHKGRVHVDSEPGMGSRFTLQLPVS